MKRQLETFTENNKQKKNPHMIKTQKLEGKGKGKWKGKEKGKGRGEGERGRGKEERRGERREGKGKEEKGRGRGLVNPNQGVICEPMPGLSMLMKRPLSFTMTAEKLSAKLLISGKSQGVTRIGVTPKAFYRHSAFTWW